MWIFILIFIIVILIVCVLKWRERLYIEETSRRKLQALQHGENVQPQQNTSVASRCGKAQTSSTQPKKKYNIPSAE